MVTNVFFSLVSFASSILLAFFVSPLILKQLGDTRYGVWALFGEMLTYYGLLDFGVRGAVNYYVGRSLANNEDDEVRRYSSSAFYALATVGLVAFTASIILILVFQDALVPAEEYRGEILGAAVLFVLIFCVGLPLEMYAAVVVGSRRAFLVSSTELIARLISTGLMFIALKYAPGMMLLCGAQLAGRLVYWVMVRRHAKRHVPQAIVSWELADFASIRNMVGYGGKNAAVEISGLVSNRKDVILTTIFLGPQFVATYTFARLVIQSIWQACSSITRPVRPNLVHHWARGEYESAYTIYYTVARYSAFLVLTAAAFLVAFAKDFYALWIGSRFVEGSWIFRTDLVLMVLLVAHVPKLMHSMSFQLLYATDRQRSLVIVTFVEALVNLALAIWLVQIYGTVGLAVATAIPAFVLYALVVPVIMRRNVGVSLRQYYLEGIGRPIAVGVVVALFGFVLRQWLPAHDWKTMATDAVLLGLFALALGCVFVLRPQDRSLLIKKAAALVKRVRQRVPALTQSA